MEACGLRRFLRENGLSLVLLALFLACIVGQAFAGYVTHNDERAENGEARLTLVGYLSSGHFLSAVSENWESEFLQMGLYVLLTVFLRQKGSAESKKLEGDEEVDEDPRRHRGDPRAPGPVKAGGLRLRLYEWSLSLALLVLFLGSFAVHVLAGAAAYNADRAQHGGPAVSAMGYVLTARFWFESLQNWQSEFLSVAAVVLLSIVLRQRGSPESKPVAAPHDQTGGG